MVYGKELLRGVPGQPAVKAGAAGCPCPLADEAALRYLRHFHGAIRWCINAHGIPAHDRNAVQQDVAVRLLLRFRLHGALEASGPSTYAITIARTACLNYWRAAQRARRVQPAEAMDTHPATDMPLDEWLERNDAHHRLHLAVATLPPLSREAMRRVLLGHSLVEIALHFDIPIGTVKSITHRARKLLRQRMAP